MKSVTPPDVEEYNEIYQDHIQRAIQRKDPLAALSLQVNELRYALDALSDSQSRFKPGPGERSIKEVIGHLSYVERVFSYRLFSVSRNDTTPLPGMKQDDYVREAGFDNRSLDDLLDEFEHLRCATIIAIQNLPDNHADRRGKASGFPVTVRALVYMLVGHVDHHRAS